MNLPPPNAARPTVTRVLTDSLVPVDGKDANGQPLPRDLPLIWANGQVHPLVPGGRIVRMFRDPDGGVEIYSVFDNDSKGMRNYIPPERLRMVEELMPLDLLEDEISIAEESDDDDDPDPREPDRPTEPPPPVNAQANGQA